MRARYVLGYRAGVPVWAEGPVTLEAHAEYDGQIMRRFVLHDEASPNLRDGHRIRNPLDAARFVPLDDECRALVAEMRLAGEGEGHL